MNFDFMYIHVYRDTFPEDNSTLNQSLKIVYILNYKYFEMLLGLVKNLFYIAL